MADENTLPLDTASSDQTPLNTPNGSYLGHVSPKAITQEIEDSYIDYAMSVIVARALPDIRDGLKPVQRRILYAMYADLALRPNSSYKKSARIVGEVLGKYHPHGDEAVYNAMARMVQPFSLRYPLVDGQGNFGSIDGDNPAAMRYTEAKLAQITDLMLRDIDKETVNWKPNFDDSLEEPIVIPSLVPNLLINGTSGIAVGMATNIPPHNLGEVIDVLNLVLDNWDRKEQIRLEDLMELIHGPDFPSGGQVLGTEGIRNAFGSGHGRIIVRAKAEITDIPKTLRHQLVFNSVPFMVNKSELVSRIARLARDGEKLTGIADMRDESDRTGTRIVIELRSGEAPERVLNQLYKHSDLQVSFSVNFRALVNGVPERLGLLRSLVLHLEHCIEIVTRRTDFLLRQVLNRAHILEGLLVAIDNIERVIHIIRNSESAQAAGETLKSELGISDRQVQAILDMALRRLAGLERQRLQEEYKEIQERVAHYEGLLADPAAIRGVIANELAHLQENFADSRRTEILGGVHPELSDEDLVTKQDELIAIWDNDNTRRTPASDFSVQGRGGVGVKGSSDRENALLESALFANSLDSYLCISSEGRAYVGKIYNLPAGSRTVRGGPIRGHVNMVLASEKMDVLLRVPREETLKSLILVTRRGRIKRMRWSAFRNTQKSGKKAIELGANDEVVQAILTDGSSDVLLVTRLGKALRTNEAKIRYQGTSASGVRGIKLRNEDELLGCVAILEDEYLLLLHSKGKGKRVDMERIRVKGRGGQGIWLVPNRKLGTLGPIAVVTSVSENAEIAVLSVQSMIVRIPASSLSIISPSAAGVKVMGLEGDDEVAGAASLPPTPLSDSDLQDFSEGSPNVSATASAV